MQRRRRPGRPLLLLLAGLLAACGGSAPAPTPLTRTPDPAAPSSRNLAPPTDPAPPVEPAFVPPARGGLAILAPADGERIGSRSLIVSGVSPSGTTVLLDGPLFLDRTVAADPWGAWSMALTLDPGRHDLEFALASIAGTRRTLSVEVADEATTAAPAVVWPPDGAAIAAGRVTLRGTATPGARVAIARDDPLGTIGVALGATSSTDADAAGRWQLPAELTGGPNRLIVVSGEHAVRHTLVRDDDAPVPAGVAPELAVRSIRALAFDDPETGLLVQVVVEVENRTDGWLDLLGGSAPTVASTAAVAAGASATRPATLLPFPRRVAPGHTALLLGELTAVQLDDHGAHPPAADNLVLTIDVGYTSAATPAHRGGIETFRLAATSGDGLSVAGRFRAGSAEPRFRVAILGYDAEGSLVAVATSAAPSRPGPYEACCLPLFGADARAKLARVVGLVTGD